MYYPGTYKKCKALYARIIGTTFTGHPTRTTLGNTLRSIAYNLYVLKLAKIPKRFYALFVSGDDVLLILSKKFIPSFKKVLYTIG
jgi:hypothetical protein